MSIKARPGHGWRKMAGPSFMKVKATSPGRAILVTVLMLASALACAGHGAAVTQPTYLYGEQVTVKVYPSGSFTVNPIDFPSRLSDTSSSFWSFSIDGKVSTTYNPLTIDHVMTPVRKTADGAVRVQFLLENEVLIDITYRVAGQSTWIAVTAMNVGPNPHTIGMRHLYDFNGKNIVPSGEDIISNELTVYSPLYQYIDIYEGTTKKGVVAFGDTYGATPPSRITYATWPHTWNTNWEYKANSTLGIGSEPAMLLYWEGLNLPLKGSVRVEHAFGGGQPAHTKKSQDLVVDQVVPEPQSQYVGKIRKVKAYVHNAGEAAQNVEVNFFVSDDYGRYITNGTVSKSFAIGENVELTWSYEVKKTSEYKVYAVIDASQDLSPFDNAAYSSVVAKPSPYKVGLRFPDDTRVDYISINSGQNAVSTVVVTNQGSVEDNITLSLSSTPTAWTTSFDNDRVNLQPGTSVQVKVVIKTAKDNNYYNYAIDVIGRSEGSGVMDKVMLFISFADIIAKSGGDVNVSGNHTKPPTTNPPTNQTIIDPETPIMNNLQLSRNEVAVVMIMFAVAVIAAVAIYQIYIVRSKMGLKGILKDFYKKLYDANTSDAYRKAIYNAYKKMCEEMAEYGQVREETLTPKEFEKQIRNYLPVDKRHLHVLTKLFEEARYSDHAFTEAKKKQALEALQGIIDSLENVTTFEEVKESKWFGKNT